MTEARPATQNQIRAEALIEDLFNDPELGPKLHERAQKKFGDIRPHPAQVIKTTIVDPEISALRDSNKALEDKLAKALERIDARDQRDAEQKTYQDMQSSVDDAVKKYSLTEDGRAKMLEWMKDNKVYNPEAAAAVIVHNAPPPPSSGPSWAPHRNDFYGTRTESEDFARLHKDPEGFRDEEIARFLTNPEKYAAEAA